MRNSGLLLLLLLALVSCREEKVPYQGKCVCDCSVDKRPCAPATFTYCDAKNRTAYYEELISGKCKEYETEMSYFGCALADVGQPGEPSAKITTTGVSDACLD